MYSVSQSDKQAGCFCMKESNDGDLYLDISLFRNI